MIFSRRRLALFALVAVTLFLGAVGWFSPQRPWQETTGWDLIVHVNPSSQLEPDIQWLGHSGFLIQWEGVHILLDPNLSESCPPVKRLFPAPRVQWPQQLDAAIISHGHYDHYDLDTLEAVPNLKSIVAPEGLGKWLPDSLRTGTLFHPMIEDRTLQVGALKIVAVKAIHSGARSHPFGSTSPALGYIISNGQTSIYFAGDTAYGEHFKQIARDHHPQIAILPIGSYEPYIVLKHHHLNPRDAVKAARDLQVDLVIPCHFGTYRLAFDRPQTALPLFARLADEAGLNWKMPELPGMGGPQIVWRKP